MSLSIKTLLPTTAAATSTTTVVPTEALPDNCHTIVIYNEDGTNDVYVAETPADGGSAIPKASATIVKPGAYLSLTIGSKSARVNPQTVFAYSTSAGTIDVNISYLCSNVV